jgi:hypothetical protein
MTRLDLSPARFRADRPPVLRVGQGPCRVLPASAITSPVHPLDARGGLTPQRAFEILQVRRADEQTSRQSEEIQLRLDACEVPHGTARADNADHPQQGRIRPRSVNLLGLRPTAAGSALAACYPDSSHFLTPRSLPLPYHTPPPSADRRPPCFRRSSPVPRASTSRSWTGLMRRDAAGARPVL